MERDLIIALVEHPADAGAVKRALENSTFFDGHILNNKDLALDIWHRVAERYRKKEEKYAIPYNLHENPKLYAIDALVIAAPLIDDPAQLSLVAQFFCVFYLMVHYFDDHVEHRDKFYSKFRFRTDSDLDTQRGAAPFSFVLLSFDMLYEILGELAGLDCDAKEHLLRSVRATLAAQTRYFASERMKHLEVDDVLKIKQREVSGQSLSILAGLLRHVAAIKVTDEPALREGLIYLGSLIQITDDIRDVGVDKTLNNANILLASYEKNGSAAAEHISRIYDSEAQLVQDSLGKIYNETEMRIIKSLPFYPFMINKFELAAED